MKNQIDAKHEDALLDDYSRDRGLIARRDRLAHFSKLGIKEIA